MMRRRQRGISLFIAKPLFIMLFLFSLFGIIRLRSNFISIEYAISDLENKKTERLTEAKTLMAERASILSMQKIEKSAIKGMGLAFPDRKKVVYVKQKEYGPQQASLQKGPAHEITESANPLFKANAR